MPHVVVVAGPNGSGKTTTAPVLLRDTLGMVEFVNADLIAAGISPFSPENASIQAGRIMLSRIKELSRTRADFGIETTLASRTYALLLSRLRNESDYKVFLIFLWVSSPEVAIARVARRVTLGGHHVPADVIERRYHRGLQNFLHLYSPLADQWQLYDNTLSYAPKIVAYGSAESIEVKRPRIWAKIAGGKI